MITSEINWKSSSIILIEMNRKNPIHNLYEMIEGINRFEAIMKNRHIKNLKFIYKFTKRHYFTIEVVYECICLLLKFNKNTGSQEL